VAETNRLQRELDITNADHIALWLEANTIPDEPMSQCISWLACRIVEAHERAVTAQPVDETERLREVIADPNAVHVNMLRGSIAKPSIAQFIHLYGEDAVRAALRPQEGEVSRG
jgi:hypothetical protein